MGKVKDSLPRIQPMHFLSISHKSHQPFQRYGQKCLTLKKHIWHFGEREREIKFIGLFEDRGHRGPYGPYKPFNHNLYIGIIIFPHIDNPQSTGYN